MGIFYQKVMQRIHFECLNSFIMIDDRQINMARPAGFVQCCLDEAILSAAVRGFLFWENEM